MRVDVIINKNAGRSDQDLIQSKIKQALFRCELYFHSPKSAKELEQIIKDISLLNCEFLIVCGGDGTINGSLSPLIELMKKGQKIPTLCIVPAGTANDLATGMGISQKIDRAVRSILEGVIRNIDVIEISANGKASYIITNGGLGIPAQTAEHANIIKSWAKLFCEEKPKGLTQFFAQATVKKFIKTCGSNIYDLVFLGDLMRWNSSSWEVEIEIQGQAKFNTNAPFIMISNQPSLGAKFIPAPFTSNIDGTFNLMILQTTNLFSQAKAIINIRRGRIANLSDCPSHETSLVRINALKPETKLTFFGDGEILQQDVSSLEIRCIHPGVPIATMNRSGGNL